MSIKISYTSRKKENLSIGELWEDEQTVCANKQSLFISKNI